MLRFTKHHILLRRSIRISARYLVTYTQGQSPRPNTREYFYYIDHQGQLFLDDTKVKNFITCFKDKKFLNFFFKRLKVNKTGRYHDNFPYISPCGHEMNYIHCDDQPIVLTHLLTHDGIVVEDLQSHSNLTPTPTTTNELLAYGGGGLNIPFSPEKLVMFPESGRVYHPGPPMGVALVKSSLALELSRFFVYKEEAKDSDQPIGFKWRGTLHTLDYSILKYLTQSN